MGLTDKVTSSVLRGGAEEAAAAGVAGWSRLTESHSPPMGPCPGPAGDGPGMRSGGGAPPVEGPGGAPPGLSGEERVGAGWPGAAAGGAEEG